MCLIITSALRVALSHPLVNLETAAVESAALRSSYKLPNVQTKMGGGRISGRSDTSKVGFTKDNLHFLVIGLKDNEPFW